MARGGKNNFFPTLIPYSHFDSTTRVPTGMMKTRCDTDSLGSQRSWHPPTLQRTAGRETENQPHAQRNTKPSCPSSSALAGGKGREGAVVTRGSGGRRGKGDNLLTAKDRSHQKQYSSISLWNQLFLPVGTNNIYQSTQPP